MDNRNIIFLTYIGRSGSTFLAKLLHKYEDIGMSLEAGLPDGIMRRPITVRNNKDIEILLKRLYSDPRLRGWGINKDILMKDLLISKKPIRYKELLYVLLNNYFGYNKKIKTYIYKCGGYINYINDVRYIFPKSKIIFILRDGRAIYNSQKKALLIRNNRPMVNNPIKSAKEYLNILRKVEGYKRERWFYILKYEELIQKTSSTLDSVLTFIGSDKKYIKNREYFDNIPENQKHLHKNIIKEPVVKRINSWENELTIDEIKIYENIALKALKSHGYNILYNKKVDYNVYFYYQLKNLSNNFLNIFKSIFPFNSFLDKVWKKIRIL